MTRAPLRYTLAMFAMDTAALAWIPILIWYTL